MLTSPKSFTFSLAERPTFASTGLHSRMIEEAPRKLSSNMPEATPTGPRRSVPS
nr:hypothetical protein [Marinicella sp. W31]MDC2875468.1 hypothetical protein [Marinicella sp. W31]